MDSICNTLTVVQKDNLKYSTFFEGQVLDNQKSFNY